MSTDLRRDVADPYRWYGDANARLMLLARGDRDLGRVRHIAPKQDYRAWAKGLCGRDVAWATGRHVRGAKTVACPACVQAYETREG